MNFRNLNEALEALRDASYEDFKRYFIEEKLYLFHKEKNPEPVKFWQSDLLIKWCRALCREALIESMLPTYFSRRENASSGFIKIVAEEKTEYLIRLIKLSQYYTVPAHWDSFAFMQSSGNSKLSAFYKELKLVKKLEADWKKKEKQYRPLVYQLDLEDLLLHTVAYYKQCETSPKIKKDQGLHRGVQMTFCYVLNDLLQVKQEQFQEDGTTDIFCKYTQEDFTRLLTGKALLIEKVFVQNYQARAAIDFYFSWYVFRRDIDRYCCGYAGFVEIGEPVGQLRSNEAYSNQRMNEHKNEFQEYLARNKAMQKEFLETILENVDHHLEGKIALDVETMVYYLEYIKLPLQLKMENEIIIDLKKVFRLVKTFSDYLIPFWIPKPEKFVRLFGNGFISVFEADQLYEGIQAYFGWEVNEVKNIIDFLTLDLLAGKNDSPDFLTHPFLKIGNQYLWISSFLTDRRWDVILHRRVIADKIIKNTGFLASQLEVELADNFRNAGFGAMASYEYKLSNDKKGEVDVLAYKEKILFVIELKTTYIIEDLMRYEKYHAQTFEDKAVQQLERSIKYIQANFEKLSRRKQLKIDCTLEELQIIPLVVSNIFEMDNVILGKGIRKISLFELLVILNDDLGYLYGEAKDLWSQAESCSAMDLFGAIKEQKIWKQMFQIKETEAPFDSLLAPYDRTQPYLTRFW